MSNDFWWKSHPFGRHIPVCLNMWVLPPPPYVKWDFWVVVVLRSPIHANEPSEYNGMLYRTSNRVLNNGIKVIILICMDGTSQYHHHRFLDDAWSRIESHDRESTGRSFLDHMTWSTSCRPWQLRHISTSNQQSMPGAAWENWLGVNFVVRKV